MLRAKEVAYNLDSKRFFLVLLGVGFVALLADYAYMLYMRRKLVSSNVLRCIAKTDRLATWPNTVTYGREHSPASHKQAMDLLRDVGKGV